LCAACACRRTLRSSGRLPAVRVRPGRDRRHRSGKPSIGRRVPRGVRRRAQPRGRPPESRHARRCRRRGCSGCVDAVRCSARRGHERDPSDGLRRRHSGVDRARGLQRRRRVHRRRRFPRAVRATHSSVNNRSSDFGLFWLAPAISRFGDPITLIALATVTYERTRSALFTALAVVIATVPTAIFGFFAGAIGDALGHRRAMFVSDVARVLLIGAVPVLLDLGAPLIVAYVCVFLAATFTAVFNPARIAIIPQLVSADRLAAANSTVAATDRTVEILGSLTAGFLVATVGAAAFYVDAATFAISAVLLAALRVRAGESRPFRLSHLYADAAEGLRFLLHQPILRV